MGLDMYLTKRIYIGGNCDFNKVTGTVDLYKDGTPIKVDLTKLIHIEEEAIYWRKANAVHNWFVGTVQNGEDNCQPHDVDYEQLIQLKEICEQTVAVLDSTPMVNKTITIGYSASKGELTKVIKVYAIDPSELPIVPIDGFFFGGTNLDEYFKYQLESTIEGIAALDPKGEYSYCSSW